MIRRLGWADHSPAAGVGHSSRIPALLALGFLAVLFYWPFTELVATGLSEIGVGDAWTVLTGQGTRKVLGFTVTQAAVSVLGTMILGLPVAHVLAL